MNFHKYNMVFKNYMPLAIKQAELALIKNEVPVGAVLVSIQTGDILTSSHNQVESEFNPLLHAEIVAINKACKILGSKCLENYAMYVTLEPCLMCAAAISYSKINRLFYGTRDRKNGGIESKFEYFNSKTCNHTIEIYKEIMEEECSALIDCFFLSKR